MNTPRKIGPMLKMADIVAVTKGDIVSQAEREVFSFNIRQVNTSARIIFVNGITGQGDTGAPSEITPQSGDTFTIVEKWLDLDTDGNVSNTEYLQGQTVLTFNGTPFTWQETYAAQGDYVIGFVVTDLDGNSQEVYQPITVQ